MSTMYKKLVLLNENDEVVDSGTDDSMIGLKDPVAVEIGETKDRFWKINKDFDEFDETGFPSKFGKPLKSLYGNLHYKKVGDNIEERDTTTEDEAVEVQRLKDSEISNIESKLGKCVYYIVKSMAAAQRDKLPKKMIDFVLRLDEIL